MSTQAITSYETTRAGFPPIPFSATNGNPLNLTFLLLCGEHLRECAQLHPHRTHTFGQRYLALTALMYAFETQKPHPARHADPGATVSYTGATTTI